MKGVRQLCTRYILASFTILLLAACGGGGGGSSAGSAPSPIPAPPPAPPTPPTPPAVAAVPELQPVTVKIFRFTWQDVADATHYRLLENPDSGVGFTQVGADIASGVQALDHVVPLYARLNAQYILQTCNADACTDSGAIDVSGSLTAAVGFVKASNTAADDSFGHAVSLSSDGTTLAVSAPDEDSADTGIDGNQSDDSADAAGAVYVFSRTNDVWSQQAYVKASNTDAGDRFGQAVKLSADGNTMAVGAVRESSGAGGIDGDQNDNSAVHAGAVYVFSRTNDVWSQQAYIKASNTDATDSFGEGLGLSADGNTLAVGASSERSNATGINGNQADNSTGAAGAVYVFSRANGVWSQQAYVKASNPENSDHFGHGIDLSADGNTLAVSARFEDSAATGFDGDQDDNSADGSGAVYVFSRTNDVWSQQAYVKASNTDAGDRFGLAVSLSADGDTMAVGAALEASAATGIDGDQGDNSAEDAGAVYVYRRTAGVWSQQTYIKAGNTDADDTFGSSVSLSSDGNTLAVGAWFEDGGGTGIASNQRDNNFVDDSGATYVFRFSGSAWSQQAYVKASNSQTLDEYGDVVSLSGDGNTLAVGAGGEDSNAGGINGDQDDNSADDSGAVYLY